MDAKVAIVTGGTRGIGREISEELARNGYAVFAFYVQNRQAAESWLDGLHAKGISCISAIQADVCTAAAAAEVDKIIARFGKIDVLVNSAGIVDHAPFEAMGVEQWQNVMKSNIDSLFFMTQPAFKVMRQNRFGRIINIASVNAHKGQKGEVNYSTSKAAMLGFTKALAQEGADFNITVNSISPGYIKTERTLTMDDATLDSIVSLVPVGRLGEPNEIARVVNFLADRHSGFITGEDISVNGGILMR